MEIDYEKSVGENVTKFSEFAFLTVQLQHMRGKKKKKKLALKWIMMSTCLFNSPPLIALANFTVLYIEYHKLI